MIISLKMFFRYLLLKIQGKKIIVTGKCLKCGRCCTKFYLKSNGSWIKSPQEFQELKKKKSEYNRLTINGKDNNGYLTFSCTWLTQNGLCKDHPNRMDICKNYPDKLRYLNNNMMPDYCGFEIIAVKPFNIFLQKETKKISKRKS